MIFEICISFLEIIFPFSTLLCEFSKFRLFVLIIEIFFSVFEIIILIFEIYISVLVMVIAVECVEPRGAAWRGGGCHLTVRAANLKVAV